MKKVPKKLTLKKEVISKLTNDEMANLKGGFTSVAGCTGWTCGAGSTRSSSLCICTTPKP